jgi:hypothetical protein
MMTDNSKNPKALALTDQYRLERLNFAKETALQNKDIYYQSATGAHKEYHRYLLIGAGAGVAFLTDQFDQISILNPLLYVSALSCFIASLVCSLQAMAARSVEHLETNADWAEWHLEYDKMIYRDCEELLAGKLIDRSQPKQPVPKTKNHDRWSTAAVGLLTGGGAITIALIFFRLF